MPMGNCPACERIRQATRVQRAVDRQRSPIAWMEAQKKARVLAREQKQKLKRALKQPSKGDAVQEQKYRRGQILLALVIDWIAMFIDCYEKDETGRWWRKPGTDFQLQVMLTAMEIVLPESKQIFKKRRQTRKEREASSLRHAFFTAMLGTARGWHKTEWQINALLESGSISPEAARLLLADCHQQVLKRFDFYPSVTLPSPHQKT